MTILNETITTLKARSIVVKLTYIIEDNYKEINNVVDNINICSIKELNKTRKKLTFLLSVYIRNVIRLNKIVSFYKDKSDSDYFTYFSNTLLKFADKHKDVYIKLHYFLD